MSVGNLMVIGRDGNYQRYVGNLENIELSLPKGVVLRVSMDQSTKSTGIYITDQDINFHVIGDLTPGASERASFYRDMQIFVGNMLKGCEIDLFVTEQVPYIKGSSSSPYLQQLKGFINTWRAIMPSLAAMHSERFAEIHPGTWKKHVVNKKKGKGRHKVKKQIAEDILDIYPELLPYFRTINSSSDYDGFDAVGIMYGYLKDRDIGGSDQVNLVEKVGGSKDYSGNIKVFYKLLTYDEIKEVTPMMVGFDGFMEMYGDNFVKTDPNISWYDNVKKCATARKFTMCMVEEDKHRTMLQWLLNFKETKKYLIAFILRKNVIDSVSDETLTRNFMHEEVSW